MEEAVFRFQRLVVRLFKSSSRQCFHNNYSRKAPFCSRGFTASNRKGDCCLLCQRKNLDAWQKQAYSASAPACREAGGQGALSTRLILQKQLNMQARFGNCR